MSVCYGYLGTAGYFQLGKDDFEPDKNLQKMAVSDNEAVIAGYGNSFFKSKDGGETWNKLNFFTRFSISWISA
jgi:photosystem II stability/assembly factor-like uncharacterized protein